MTITILPKILPGLVLLTSPCCKAISIQADTVTRTALKSDVFEKTAAKAVKEGITGKSTEAATTTATKILPKGSATTINTSCEMSAEELDAAIAKLLPKKNLDKNPMRGKGSVFWEMGKKYGVNPISIIAIAMHESARGISSGALKKNNIGGLMGKKGLMTFKSVDDCIEKMAQILQRHTQNRRETISKLGNSGRYCAKSSAKNWIKDVNFYIKQLESKK